MTTTIDYLTLALVVITAIYAFVTYLILRANKAVVAGMREQQKAMFRPYVEVSVALRPGTQLLYLSIKNTGRSPAQALTLELDRPVHAFKNKDRNIGTYSAFSNQIDSLAPGVQILFYIATGPDVFAEGVDPTITPNVFSVTAKYRYLDDQLSETTTIDLRPFDNSAVPLDPVAEEIKALRESVAKLPAQLAQALKS